MLRLFGAGRKGGEGREREKAEKKTPLKINCGDPDSFIRCT